MGIAGARARRGSCAVADHECSRHTNLQRMRASETEFPPRWLAPRNTRNRSPSAEQRLRWRCEMTPKARLRGDSTTASTFAQHMEELSLSWPLAMTRHIRLDNL